jgi:hypothetical protein
MYKLKQQAKEKESESEERNIKAEELQLLPKLDNIKRA